MDQHGSAWIHDKLPLAQSYQTEGCSPSPHGTRVFTKQIGSFLGNVPRLILLGPRGRDYPQLFLIIAAGDKGSRAWRARMLRSRSRSSAFTAWPWRRPQGAAMSACGLPSPRGGRGKRGCTSRARSGDAWAHSIPHRKLRWPGQGP